MIPRLVFLLLPVLVAFSVLPETTSAQFEGEITFRAYEPDKPENPHRYMRFVATPQRIFMNSEDRYRVFSGLDADGFLVRNDRDDFIFMSGENDALRISKEDVESLAGLIRRMQGGSADQRQNFDWDGRAEVTGETKTIRGYKTEQIRVYEQNTQNYVSVWLTDEIKVNWGILQDTWHQSMALVVDVDLPVEVFMNRNSFPLQIEYYRNGMLTTLVEAVQARSGSVDKKLVEVPDGMTMMGITDLMMRMMRDRR